MSSWNSQDFCFSLCLGNICFFIRKNIAIEGKQKVYQSLPSTAQKIKYGIAEFQSQNSSLDVSFEDAFLDYFRDRIEILV
jgi:hypothetical protein